MNLLPLAPAAGNCHVIDALSVKHFLIDDNWIDHNIPTEFEPDENGKTKALTIDGLKDAIAHNINPEHTFLIFPEVKQLTISVRYWFGNLIDAGLTVVDMTITNPGKDVSYN